MNEFVVALGWAGLYGPMALGAKIPPRLRGRIRSCPRCHRLRSFMASW